MQHALFSRECMMNKKENQCRKSFLILFLKNYFPKVGAGKQYENNLEMKI